MTREEVVNLMRSSNSEKEWNDNCLKVKEAFAINIKDYPPNGFRNYPSFWFEEIILSGLMREVFYKMD